MYCKKVGKSSDFFIFSFHNSVFIWGRINYVFPNNNLILLQLIPKDLYLQSEIVVSCISHKVYFHIAPSIFQEIFLLETNKARRKNNVVRAFHKSLISFI